MRPDDRARLNAPYPEADDEVDYRFARRLDVYVEKIVELEREILSDLDETLFGIGWWAPHPGTKRRILISNYLWQLCHSIHQNLIEAKLHLLEARGAWAGHASQLERGLAVESGQVRFEMPQLRSPIEELDGELFRLHVGGFFRAVGSTFDCVGGSLVAVAGLQTDLLKADLAKAYSASPPATSTGSAEKLQRSAVRGVEEAMRSAGPPGWNAWAESYRNMLVHRGRRTEKRGGSVRVSPVLDARGGRIPRLQSFALLPRDPGRSDVEVALHLAAHDYLTEDALGTLEGVQTSLIAFARGAVTVLLETWRDRRSQPGLIVQPRKQWEHIKPADKPFGGYADGTQGTGFKEVHVSPMALKRLRAAALTSDLRHRWDEFD